MSRIRRLLNDKRGKLLPTTETNLGLSLLDNTKPLAGDVFNSLLSQYDLSESERNSCNKYKIFGTIKLITNNILSPSANEFDWDFLFDGKPALTPNNWLIQVLYPSTKDENVKIHNNPANMGIPVDNIFKFTEYDTERVGVTYKGNHNLNVGDFMYIYNPTNNFSKISKVYKLGDVSGFNETRSVIYEDIEPIPNHTLAKRISGPSNNDINFVEPKNITGGSVSTSVITFLTDSYDQVTKGEYIDVRGGGVNGIYKIEETFSVGSLRGFKVKNPFATSITITYPLQFRVLDGTPSEYYARRFEVLTTNQYETHKTAFARTIYPNTVNNEFGVINYVYSFQFNRDVDLTDKIDYKNSVPTELYLGFIRRAGQNTFDFSTVRADWDFNSKIYSDLSRLEVISTRMLNGVGTIEKSDIGDKYIGDFVEYNRLELVENKVNDVVHIFRPSNPDKPDDNYYFNPFKPLQIRTYSNNIETIQSGETIGNLPSHVLYYPDGSGAWRDILSIGYFEDDNGVDYPYLNDRHYLYSDNVLYIRTQKNYGKKVIIEPIKIGNPEC
jgi:hypothetical protein